jgi:hypothetical protein
MQLWNVNNNNKTATTTTPADTINTNTTFILVRHREIIPLVLNLGCREKCLIRITSQTIFPFESTPVPIKNEAGWAPAPGWIL